MVTGPRAESHWTWNLGRLEGPVPVEAPDAPIRADAVGAATSGGRTVPSLERLPQTDEEGHLRAVVETPQGSRHKLAYEPSAGAFTIKATMPAGMNFPFDFGFFPRTRAADGDPLDVLVLMDGPAYPGCLVPVRLLGVIEAEQSEDGGEPVRNDRLIAVADGSTERGDLRSVRDFEPSLVEQLESFFVTYDRFEGKDFRILALRGPRRAQTLLKAAAVSPQRPRTRKAATSKRRSARRTP
jgi:inorganic pyrophosphatase